VLSVGRDRLNVSGAGYLTFDDTRSLRLLPLFIGHSSAVDHGWLANDSATGAELLTTAATFGHGCGLNANGCHTNRNGGLRDNQSWIDEHDAWHGGGSCSRDTRYGRRQPASAPDKTTQGRSFGWCVREAWRNLDRATQGTGGDMAVKLEPINIGGERIWIEVEDFVSSGKTSPTAAHTARDVAGELGLVDLAAPLKAVLSPIREALQSLAPSEVEVELCLGFKGEVGVFLAKSEGSASVKVTARWSSTPT
jgi:hypothetical protein